MTHAFVVIVTLPDGVDPAVVATEISADLDDFDVVSVHPWASPTSPTTLGLTPTSTIAK